MAASPPLGVLLPSGEARAIARFAVGFALLAIALGALFLFGPPDSQPAGVIMIVGGLGYAYLAARSVACRVICTDSVLTVRNIWRTSTFSHGEIIGLEVEPTVGDISGNGLLMGLPTRRQLVGVVIVADDRRVRVSASRRRDMKDLARDWSGFLAELQDHGARDLEARLQIRGPDGQVWPSSREAETPVTRYRPSSQGDAQSPNPYGNPGIP